MTPTTKELARDLEDLAGGRMHRDLPDTLRAAAARLRELETLVGDAAEEIETWGAYAGDYFIEKHGLAETVERFRRAANPPPTTGREVHVPSPH